MKICVGLDLDSKTPLGEYIKLIEMIDADFFKLNPAFNPNLTKQISAELNKRNKKWIYDGKLGDVPHTNEKYAKYVYEELGASGTTLNPYVGLEALRPFFKYKGKTNFILCKTTNKEHWIAQRSAWREVVDFVKKEKQGLVFPSNSEILLSEVSQYLGNDSLILSPGVGVQGGKPRSDLSNVLYSVSRSVIFSSDPEKALRLLKETKHKSTTPLNLSDKIEQDGLIKRGSFQLSSGETSDVYIDLRGASNNPDLFSEISHGISRLVKDQNHVLGVESASISLATSVALSLGAPFGYVRKEKKNHGAKKQVEGLTISDSNITIIEDVITTGGSVLKAIESCRAEGFKVNQVVAVLDRNGVARQKLSEIGVELECLISSPVSSPYKKG